MRRTTACLALLALAAGATNSAAAQGRGRDRGLVELPPEGTRRGVFLTGGLGDGSEQYRYSDSDPYVYSPALGKPSLLLRLGGTPSQNVRLGGEFFGWWNHRNDVGGGVAATEYFTALLLTAEFYPGQRSGFFLKGGAGLGWNGVSFYNGSGNQLSGFAWTAGAGYEFPLSRSIALGPAVDFYQASFDNSRDASDPYTLSERVLNLGVQITFQSGGRRR